jgi:hypothetical protein
MVQENMENGAGLMKPKTGSGRMKHEADSPQMADAVRVFRWTGTP